MHSGYSQTSLEAFPRRRSSRGQVLWHALEDDAASGFPEPLTNFADKLMMSFCTS